MFSAEIKDSPQDAADVPAPRFSREECSTVPVDRSCCFIGIRGSTTYIVPSGMPDTACDFVPLTGLVL
jgi:hypothetical protein